MDDIPPTGLRRAAVAVPVAFALTKLALHLAVNLAGMYGYFRDEFYYLACADHLAWGYVDQPPLSIGILWVVRALFGESMFAIRLVPACAGAGVVLLVGLLARQMGGGRVAQAFACTGALVSPLYMGIVSLYSMNSVEILFWALAAWMTARMFASGNLRLWIPIGLIVGLGLLNKISMGWYAMGLVFGILLSEHRRMLATPWPWASGGIALLLFLPHLLWQAGHDWPTLEFMRNAQLYKNAPVSFADFMLGQIRELHPFAFPLWGTGLVALFFRKELRTYRPFGILYLSVFALLVLQHGKVYYLAPAYPALLAAGGITIADLLALPRWRWLRISYMTLLAAGGLLVAPFALPILPIDTYISYAEALGVTPTPAEKQSLGKLPQHFADRFGWKEMVEVVSRVYQSLPDSEKAVCGIFTQNYGEAGAIDFFGKDLGLPRALSGHNNYWYWPPDREIRVVIVIGGNPSDHAKVFDDVQPATRIHADYAMPYESNLPVFVCRRPKVSLAEVWPRVKHFI